MPQRRLAQAALFLVLAAGSPALAEDDVDLQIRGNEKILGTLRPADERERFLYDAPRDAVVTATVKRSGTGGPTPILELIDVADAVVATGTTTRTGAKLPRFKFPASALYRLRVAGDLVKDGDYSFTAKVGPRKAWSLKPGPDVAPSGETTFAFAAPMGSTVDIDLTPASGSHFEPRIVDVDGPGAYLVAVDPGNATSRRHVVRRLVLGATGEYAVRIRNVGVETGAWSIAVRVATPRISKVSVDIRDSALTGSFGGDSQVFGRIVDLAGGLIDPSSVGGALSGTSVDVPANAVPSASVIAISASDTFFVDDENHPAGVAITLTPAGTTFEQAVTVTVPYDPQAFDDPLTELTIYIQDSETGVLEPVPHDQLDIDTVANTVSFPTTHFSRFQGTSPKDRPVSGKFVQLELGGRTVQGFGGQVVFGLSGFDGLKGSRTNNTLSRVINRRSIGFDATSINHGTVTGTADGGVIQVQSDQVVTMATSLDGALKFLRGRAPDVLIQPPAPAAPGTSLSILMRVAKGAATPANLAGDWNVFVVEVGAELDAKGAVLLGTVGQRGRVAIGLDGSIKPKSMLTETATAAAVGPGGTWDSASSKALPASGSLSIAPSRLLLSMELGKSPLIKTMDLVPVLRGDVLVGIGDAVIRPQKDVLAAVLRLVLFVRVPKAAGPVVLGQRNFFSSFGMLPTDRPDASQDLWFAGHDLLIGRNGRGASTLNGSLDTFSHDASGAAVSVRTSVSQPGNYSVSRDGLYHESAPLAFGAVVPRSGFYVVTKFTGPVFAIGFGVVAPTGP